MLEAIEKIFPKDRYQVNITGKAVLFLEGTKYLINNLFLSLSLAILLIALFMAYLGFDGLTTEQLNQLHEFTGASAILTTNHSALLPGFYAFTGFVLFSLFISQKTRFTS